MLRRSMYNDMKTRSDKGIDKDSKLSTNETSKGLHVSHVYTPRGSSLPSAMRYSKLFYREMHM
jgi:hypothetical protein